MTEKRNEISDLKDKELIEKFGVLVKEEKEATASVVTHLAEIDRRKLYALEGYSSLFSYCVEKYHYSESEAFLRIQACRLSQSFPEVLKFLEEGKLTLTALKMISPYVTQENKNMFFERVQHKTKRELELLLAELFPQEEEVIDTIRHLPQSSETQTAQNLTRSGTSTLSKIRAKGIIKPMTAQRVKIELSASESLAKKIQRAKELLRHKYPEGKLEDILNEALELLLNKKDPQRKIQKKELAKEEVSQKESQTSLKMYSSLSDTGIKTRYVPEKIKQDIYKRDEGKCSYISPNGKPCGERNFLELDHVQPWALGGKSSEDNLQLLCRTHNQWRSEKTFGKFMGPIGQKNVY